MPVVEKVQLNILSDDDLKGLEQKVVKLEKLEQRRVKATDSIKNKDTKRGGIFASTEGQEALPSNIIRKRRKLEDEISRSSDSILAGLDKSKDKKSKSAIVKASEFTQLQNQVNANEKVLSIFSKGQGLVAGAAGLTTASGIFGSGLGAAKAIPGVGIALFAAKLAYDKFVSQFGKAGTKDTRKKVLAEDVSDIGVETESDVASGRKLFLSNPMNNQGLPTGNSNTQNLRDGIRIHKLRKEGTYF